jgi:hypothetical protein
VTPSRLGAESVERMVLGRPAGDLVGSGFGHGGNEVEVHDLLLSLRDFTKSRMS